MMKFTPARVCERAIAPGEFQSTPNNEWRSAATNLGNGTKCDAEATFLKRNWEDGSTDVCQKCADK